MYSFVDYLNTILCFRLDILIAMYKQTIYIHATNYEFNFEIIIIKYTLIPKILIIVNN